MIKQWNFLFFLTWVVLLKIFKPLIQKPLFWIILKFYPKKKKKNIVEFNKFIRQETNAELNPKNDGEIGSAFKVMLTSTSFALVFMTFSIAHLFDINLKGASFSLILLPIMLSLLLNYVLLGYLKDKFLTYFYQFRKQPLTRTHKVVGAFWILLPLIVIVILVIQEI